MDSNINNIDKVLKTFNAISESTSITLNDLLSLEFMKKYTKFSSLSNFIDNSPYKINLEQDFINIENPEFNEFILKFTEFKNWKEMYKFALEKYLMSKLKL